MDIPLSIWMYICFPICFIGFTWMMVRSIKDGEAPVSREQEQGPKA